MIRSSRRQFEIVYPYILERDRNDEKPTVWGLRLLSPEVNVAFAKKFYACVQQDGQRGQNLNDQRFLSTENERLDTIIEYVENVEYEDESGKVIPYDKIANDTEDNSKLIKKIVMGLDSHDRQELSEAGTKRQLLDECTKKK